LDGNERFCHFNNDMVIRSGNEHRRSHILWSAEADKVLFWEVSSNISEDGRE
jgi:hypothetical protein